MKMPKINREEYEVLKTYIGEEKYIAKDRDGSIRILEDFPERVMKKEEWSDGWGKTSIQADGLFQFISWSDEPCSITELIEEYESSEEIILHEDFDVDNLTFKELDGFKQTLKVIKESEELEE